MKGNCVKMCSTILHHDIEEIKYHLSEIVSLKEIEIMEARRKAAEREEQEQAKQIAQEEQIKNVKTLDIQTNFDKLNDIK